MDPLSISGIVASIPGLFTSCLQIYGLISSAASHGPDFQVMLSKVDVEHARFILWGGTVGLLPSSTSSTGSGIDPRIVHPHLRETIAGMLFCIQKSFDDAEKLKKRYGLVSGEGKSSSLSGDSMQLYGRSTPAFLSLSIFKGIYERQQSAAVETQKQNSVLKRARWAIVDRERFNTAIVDLKTFNDSLHNLLPDVEWKTQERLRQEVLDSQDEDVLRLLQQASEGAHPKLNRAATIRLSKLNSRHQLPQIAASPTHELPVTNGGDFSDTRIWDVTTGLGRAFGQDPYLEAAGIEKPLSRSFPIAATLAGPWDQDEYNASAYVVELPAGDFNSSVELPLSASPVGIRRSTRSLKRKTPDVPESPNIAYLAGLNNLLDSPNYFSGEEVTLPLNGTISELSAETPKDAPPKLGVQHRDGTSPPATPTEAFYICIDFQDRGTRAAIAHSSAPKSSDVVGGWPDNDACDSYIQSAWVPSVLAYDMHGSGSRWGHQVQRSQDQAGWFIAHLQGERTGLMAYLRRHGKTLQIALEDYFDHLLRHLLEAAEKKYERDVYITSGIGCALIVSNKWENSVCTPLKDAVSNALFSLGINLDVTLQVDTSLAASSISTGLFAPHLGGTINTDGNFVEENDELFMVCHINSEAQSAITIQTFQALSAEVTSCRPPKSSSIGMESIFNKFKKFLECHHEHTGIRSRKSYDIAHQDWLGVVQDFSGKQNSTLIPCPYYPNCYECKGGELSITKGEMEMILSSFFREVCVQVREELGVVIGPMGRSQIFKGIYLCGEFGSRSSAMCDYLRREMPEHSIYQLPRSATEVATGATVAALKHGRNLVTKEILG